MHRLGVIGLHWRHAGTEAVAQFTRPREDRVQTLQALSEKLDVKELVYLATCNRVEIALVRRGEQPLSAYRPLLFAALAGREPTPGEAERTLRAWDGEGAVEHLFLVASGLDSARLGETEIAGQLREAFQLSRENGFIGPRLGLAFDTALRVASRVHTGTKIGTGKLSMAELAVDHVRRRLDRTPGKVALIGVSPMTDRCGRTLAEAGVPLVVVNRTLSTARELADAIGVSARALEEFRKQPDAVEAVISATGASEPVLARNDLERLAACAPSGEPPLLIDMALPADVAAEDADSAGCPRIELDRILREAEQHRDLRLNEVGDARELIDRELEMLTRRWVDRLLAPILGGLQRRYRKTAVEGVERLVQRHLPDATPEQRESIAQWAQTLARRFAHIPAVGLRGLAYEHGSSAVEAFLDSLDEELSRELRGAERGTPLALPEDLASLRQGNGGGAS